MTASGMRVTPQASSWGECGIMTKPTLLARPVEIDGGESG